jgi:glycosyltransferase involved in cell wall biosynthesis
MKRLFGFLFFLAVVFGGSYVGSQWIEPKSKILRQGAVARFQPTQFPLKNRPFAVVVVGRDNGAVVAKTLASIFNQNYENYRVVYVDDASSDGSFDLVKDLVYDGGRYIQVELVQNEQRLGVLASLVKAVKACADEEIVVVVGGEDWLAHEWVLQRLNAYYDNPDLWMTYGQYCEFPS